MILHIRAAAAIYRVAGRAAIQPEFVLASAYLAFSGTNIPWNHPVP